MGEGITKGKRTITIDLDLLAILDDLGIHLSTIINEVLREHLADYIIKKGKEIKEKGEKIQTEVRKIQVANFEKRQ